MVERASLHPELGAYRHVSVATGDLVFVSGQVPLTPDGELVGRDPDDQADQVVVNLIAALAGAGLEPSDAVKLTTFATSAEAAQSLSRAREQHFDPPYPASTVVLVAALLSPDWLLEVEAVAAKPRS